MKMVNFCSRRRPGLPEDPDFSRGTVIATGAVVANYQEREEEVRRTRD